MGPAEIGKYLRKVSVGKSSFVCGGIQASDSAARERLCPQDGLFCLSPVGIVGITHTMQGEESGLLYGT